jgi:hypothetical protein
MSVLNGAQKVGCKGFAKIARIFGNAAQRTERTRVLCRFCNSVTEFREKILLCEVIH